MVNLPAADPDSLNGIILCIQIVLFEQLIEFRFMIKVCEDKIHLIPVLSQIYRGIDIIQCAVLLLFLFEITINGTDIRQAEQLVVFIRQQSV